MDQYDPLPRLADALLDMSNRLQDIGTELRAVAQRPTPAAQPAPPVPPVPPVVYVAPPQFAPAQFAPPPFAPPFAPRRTQQFAPRQVAAPLIGPQLPPGWQPPTPQASMPRSRTVWERISQDGAGSRVLAWAGGVVTLLGVVLLLVLAVQRGYLGPPARVLLGAGLGATLAGLGVRLRRTPANRTGAFALTATGFAVLYLDVVAATTLYHYLPPVLGLLAGAVLAGVGLVLAGAWDSQALAVFVVLGCACCAPVLTHGFTPLLLGFLLVLMAATAPVQLRRTWPGLLLAAGLPPAVAAVVLTGLAGFGSAEVSATVLLALVTSVLMILSAVLAPHSTAAVVLMATAPVPALLATVLLPRTGAAVLAAGVAAVLLPVWVAHRVGVPRLDARVALVAGAGSAVALVQASVLAVRGTALPVLLLAEAVLFGLVALRTRQRAALLAATAFGGLGVLTAVRFSLPPGYLSVSPVLRPQLGALAAAAGTGVLLVLVVLVLVLAARRLDELPGPDANPVVWAAAAALALYGASGAVLTAGLLISPDRTGFLTGHVLVTLSWTVAALVLLVRGIDRLALRVTGLVLVGAAVAKLVLFDLSSLDGLARVAAFLGAGLVLLAAGTRYARLVSTRQSTE